MRASGTMSIRRLLATDWPAVEAIYAAGIAGGSATFETATPSWDYFDESKLADHRLVATVAWEAGLIPREQMDAGQMDARRVVGWVAASAVSSRLSYSGVVEHSVYVDPAFGRRGIGLSLLRALIDSTEAAGIWTIQSGIFPENTASLALHRRAGFCTIGIRRKIGRHHGVWRDTVLIERRSSVVI